MAEAVAGVGGVGVGGVGAPGLILGTEDGFELGAGESQDRADDFARGFLGWCLVVFQEQDGVDGRETLGPGAAEKLHEDSFGLVVAGVGGEDGVGLAGG